MKLTFIGNGNMAQALIKGLMQKYEIEVFGRNQTSLNALQNELPTIQTKLINQNIDLTGKHIVLCVKPYSLADLAPKLSGQAETLYSVLAGTSLESIAAQIPAKKIVRAMPNLGAAHLKSMTTLTGEVTLK